MIGGVEGDSAAYFVTVEAAYLVTKDCNKSHDDSVLMYLGLNESSKEIFSRFRMLLSQSSEESGLIAQ